MNRKTGKIVELLIVMVCAAFLAAGVQAAEPVVAADLTFAPNVPPPVTRHAPAIVQVDLEAVEKVGVLMKNDPTDTTYEFWTFNGHVPGPFIRARVGDTLEVHLKNSASSHMVHNVDFHAVSGPGGGSLQLFTAPGQESIGRFKLLSPGLYVYHCSTPPMTQHIANGMYGLILVEPEKGLPPVDHEYYIMQGEFYTHGHFGDPGRQTYDAERAEAEQPTYVVFNGRVDALKGEDALQAKTGETVRFYFGVAGPNLISSFHIIGAYMQRVYHDGSLEDPWHNVQTTVVPPGGASIVEFQPQVPGDYTFVDHSGAHMDKGAEGVLHATGAPRPDLYQKIK